MACWLGDVQLGDFLPELASVGFASAAFVLIPHLLAKPLFHNSYNNKSGQNCQK